MSASLVGSEMCIRDSLSSSKARFLLAYHPSSSARMSTRLAAGKGEGKQRRRPAGYRNSKGAPLRGRELERPVRGHELAYIARSDGAGTGPPAARLGGTLRAL
eukprot:7237670-Alexandrium_andersonii.AAC.1